VEAASAVDPSTAENKKLHDDFVAEIRKRELSGSENFDKSVLTFSSAGLALSVGFFKDFGAIQSASVPWALYTSWTCFTVSTCLTITSFLVSGIALRKHENIAHRYYIQREEGAVNEPNRWNAVTTYLNYVSGLLFISAMLLTTLFISLNLQNGTPMKSGKLDQAALGATVPTMQASGSSSAQKGLPVPAMQKVPTQGSAPAVPSSQAPSVLTPNSSATKPSAP
jgi:hypothetical protein